MARLRRAMRSPRDCRCGWREGKKCARIIVPGSQGAGRITATQRHRTGGCLMIEPCNYALAVSAAIKSKSWDEETSTHVTSCVHCSEMIRVAEWTRSLATNFDQRP